LAAVVGVAVVGGLPADRPAEPPAPSVAVVAATPVPSVALLSVDTPDRPGAVITTRDLVVRGSVQRTGLPLQVTLESSGAKLLLGRETVQPSPAPLLAPSGFEIAFPLADPRPTGRVVVEVTALSPAGVALEVVRIPVTIGALAPSTPREVGRDGEGGLGDDGIVGGIVFGNAWDPEALGP
jgi:hypothetical protein